MQSTDRTKALMPHLPSSILDTMRAPHSHERCFLVVIKGAYLYKDDAGEKRVGQANSFLCRADTNIGAEAIKPKAPSSTRKGRESSTSTGEVTNERVPLHKEPDACSGL